MIRVVIIEDDAQIRRFLRTILEASGYQTHEAKTGEHGLSLAAAKRADLVLLDLGLPDLDGLTVLQRLRTWSTTPVIVLSARGSEATKVAALDQGADDYLVKPFGSDELLARMRVVARRIVPPTSGQPIYQAAGVRVDLANKTVEAHGKPVHLTPTEFKLLSELVCAAGRVVTHRQLLRAVWGPSHAEDVHYLRLYMAQLRAKLERDSTNPLVLQTEQGVGYRLTASEPVSEPKVR